MNKDRLEDFVRDRREEFDSIEPGEHLWKNIKPNISDEKVNTSRRVSMNRYLRIASQIAAAVLIFIASYYYHDYKSSVNDIVVADSQQDSELYNTLVEAGYYYNSKIDLEKEKLYSLTAGNTILREEIQDELNELDEEFMRLKEDLNDNMDNEEIIAAMIRNYRLKLQILQDMMLQIQDDNNAKKSGYETKRIEI